MGYKIGQCPALQLRHLPFTSREVVEQKGGTVWPSGRLLAHFVALRLLRRLPGCRVLELGCGAAALPGLVAARLGAEVVLTDLPEVTAVAKQNAVSNGLHVEARSLTWAAAPPDGWDFEPFDLVLAADVLYDLRQYESLAATLEWTVAVGGVAVIATQLRRSDLQLGAGRAAGHVVDEDAFFVDVMPKRGWFARRLDVEEMFDAMGSNHTFRSNFDVWVCWRGSDMAPEWCGRAAAARDDVDSDSDASSDVPFAPPEESDSSDDEPVLAPPESEDEGQ